MPKPASDLERFLAGAFAEPRVGLPAVVLLLAVLLIAACAVL